MGGVGSGNRSRWGKRTTVESCYVLDVQALYRLNDLRCGTRATARWLPPYYEESQQTASVTVERTVSGFTLGYTLPHQGERREHIYPVDVADVPCTYGGTRPYFICPGVKNGIECRRRVAKLYLPPYGRYFLCRHCYDLTYASCNEAGDAYQTAARRTRRAARKLGINSLSSAYALRRPKGMHRATFQRLLADLRVCRRSEHEALGAWIAEKRRVLDTLTAIAERS